MEFRILGPLYADDGTGRGPASIKQPLLQSALALLLLRANRPCPRGMLIEALWANEPPGSPEAALRVCISRLRRSLGACAERLESIGPPGGRAPGHRQQRGYMMTVRPGELDVEEFTDLVAQGQAELDTGNPAAAAASLMHALALWGDPPLPDLPDCDVVAPDIERLTNLRQAAADTLIEAHLAAGETEQVLGPLRATVSERPGRERPYEQLMRAYYTLGMRKEALDVYREARRAMRELQGTEPGQSLALLQQRILAEEMAADSAALSAISPSAPLMLGWQAPAPPNDFTGRQAELAVVMDSLAGPSVPVVVLCGGPGTGKTSLAAVAAMHLRDRFCDGQLYAELGGAEHPRNPQDVLGEMLRTIGISPKSIPQPGPARGALYRALLAGRKVLVIADDAAAARQVRPLVPAAGGAAILVTSRGRLSGLAAATTVELGALSEEDALVLLGSAGSHRVAAEPAAARAIIAACAYLPLAVRLAAAVLAERPRQPLARLAAELGERSVLDVLVAEDTSVAGAIGASYRVLPSPAQAALCTAAANLPGDVPGWALAEIAEGDPKVADQLASVGLVAPAQADTTDLRYRLDPLTRAYAQARRLPRRSEAGVLRRLRAGWLRRSQYAARQLPAVPFVPLAPPVAQSGEPDRALDHPELSPDWLGLEHANLDAAVQQASSSGAHREAIALASCLTPRLCITGRYSEATSLWHSVASSAAGAGERTAAMANFYLAAVLIHSHDRADAGARVLAACVPVLEQADDRETAALGWCQLGRHASVHGRHAAAMRLARRAIELSAGRPFGALVHCAAQTVLGLTLARVGACDTAVQHCRQACSEARGTGEPIYEAHAILALAQAVILGGEYDQAVALCLDGISLARSYGSDVDAARFELVIGRARQCCREPGAAIPSLLTAADAFCEAGLVLDEITARGLLVTSYRSVGDMAAGADQSELVSQLLARSGITDPEQRAAELQRACELPDRPPSNARNRPLISD
jgi:DNA-binding SARP family transcriptional activator